MIKTSLQLKALTRNLSKGDSGKAQFFFAIMRWKGFWNACLFQNIKIILF